MVRLSDVSYSFDFKEAAQLLFLLGNQGRYHILSLLCANESMPAAKAVYLELVISSKSMAYVMRYIDFPH